MGQFLCIGHRGACGHEPENTLRSIRRALELGVDGIEIDVRLARGELVVLHDASVDRTTDGRGYVFRKSLDELRPLDAGKGERIPTLREVFETVDRRAFINVELKGRLTARPARILIDEFFSQRNWTREHVLISSFRRTELRHFVNSGIPIGLLVGRPTRFYYLPARRLGAWSINVALRHVSPAFIHDAHARGFKVLVYTVNDMADIARMRQWQVDGVFSDFPERVALS